MLGNTNFCRGGLQRRVLQKLRWSCVWDAMEDLSAVPQENVVDYLLERLQRGQIYTWVGTLLLAINPNGEISTAGDIYDLSRAHGYDNICDVTHKEVSPHIFAVAARAHYRIVHGLGKLSQVIVLNGETGTGKTFNAWKALEFLTRSASADAQRRDVVCGIVRRVTDACRLISAFTTAPTERNEVSSRHVQLVWLQYKAGNICGAMISSYLLERDRVTKGCGNFQIFGQMMTAVASIEFADTGLSRDTRYFVLSDLDPPKVQGFRDGFRETLRAMDMLGFTESQKKDIFLVLSLLVHMGNIRFVQKDDHCTIDTDNQQSREALENTCQLACIEKEGIVELLTSILINPQSTRRRHTMCRRNLNTSDACCYRLHSIIRHLYDLLFHWLISSVNEILSARLFSERLGILDIFGFECFDSNGIEQLCINYVNERLQQYFVERYLVSCRKDLQKEGLIADEEPSEIARLYEDRISTIEKYLFAPLNDVCLSTVPKNSSTLIRQVCANSCPATTRFLSIRGESFVVRHYGGAVEYSVCDLLSKNTDKIPDEIVITFGVSRNKFLYSLINESTLHHGGKAKRPTMLSKLRCNVDLLIQELNECDTHYVRCIKPQRLNGHEWDRDEVRRQLANTGILDALPLARCKYPIHFAYKDFFKRYSGERTETSDLPVACKNILVESSLPTMDDNNSSVHYGKRLIFLTESAFLRLESARRRYRAECVRKIESFWIKHKNYTRQNMRNNITVDTRAIANIQNESIEKSQLGCKPVVPVLGRSLYAVKYRPQDMKENTAGNAQAIVNANIRNEQIEKSQSEYKCIIQVKDCPTFQKHERSILSRIFDKTAYISHWLEGVNKVDIKSVEYSVSEQPRVNRDCDQLVDTNCNKDTRLQRTLHTRSGNNTLRIRNGRENFGNYNEKEDMYIIQYGTTMLFYKNGVLSRRRPARLPVRVHTRLRCLTNSHYSVHTELPQGLQDCL